MHTIEPFAVNCTTSGVDIVRFKQTNLDVPIHAQKEEEFGRIAANPPISHIISHEKRKRLTSYRKPSLYHVIIVIMIVDVFTFPHTHHTMVISQPSAPLDRTA